MFCEQPRRFQGVQTGYRRGSLGLAALRDSLGITKAAVGIRRLGLVCFSLFSGLPGSAAAPG